MEEISCSKVVTVGEEVEEVIEREEEIERRRVVAIEDVEDVRGIAERRSRRMVAIGEVAEDTTAMLEDSKRSVRTVIEGVDDVLRMEASGHMRGSVPVLSIVALLMRECSVVMVGDEVEEVRAMEDERAIVVVADGEDVVEEIEREEDS